jgi:hypothetical protein
MDCSNSERMADKDMAELRKLLQSATETRYSKRC